MIILEKADVTERETTLRPKDFLLSVFNSTINSKEPEQTSEEEPLMLTADKEGVLKKLSLEGMGKPTARGCEVHAPL